MDPRWSKIPLPYLAQDVFFHIFNHLHQNGKQIILTSDKPPVEMQGMEQRLLSRFKWGLSADLAAPDLETRMAILEKKMYGNGIDLPKDVTEYLAYSINTNPRCKTKQNYPIYDLSHFALSLFAFES